MKPILNDPLTEPTLDVLKNALGNNFSNYQTLLELIDKYSLTAEWRYYNDGKSWLCKVQHKKKTIFWLSIWADCFKTSFFFTEKNVEGIALLPIAEKLKQEFLMEKVVGKLLPMIIVVKDHEPLPDINTVIQYKLSKK